MAIYLDHNATTPLDSRVLESMLPWLQNLHGNPSSIHVFGRRTRAIIDTAREQVAELVNAHPSQIVFTSSGTEANNLAIKGVTTNHVPTRVAISAIEHASVHRVARSLRHWQIDILPVDSQGQVITRTLTLHPNTALVSVMWANNETGVIQDVKAIAEVVQQTGAIFHTDASQAVGKLPVDFAKSGAQLMTLSAHKFYGPQGIGALVIDKACDLEPLLHGGGQEKGYRSGTENIAAIVGFGHAAILAKQELAARMTHWRQLRQQLENALRKLPGVHIIGEKVERLANTVMITVDHFHGETLVMGLDRCGIAVSSGSACHSAHLSPSSALLAMGIEPERANQAIRISLGMKNTSADIHHFIAVLQKQLETRTIPDLATIV